VALTRTTAAGPPHTGAAVGPPRRVLCLGLAVGWLALDVVTKILVVARLANRPPVTVVPGHVQLTLLRNPGSAFSLATGYTAVLSLLAVVVVVAVVRLSRRLRSVGWAVALGLLLGGAAGNLSDRIFRAPGFLRGYVVDWIQLYAGSHSWPVFNVADSGITVAAVLVVVLSLTGRRVDGTRVTSTTTGTGAGAGDDAGTTG
jgi:signal peptidase II